MSSDLDMVKVEMKYIAHTDHPTLRTDLLQASLGCLKLITKLLSDKQILTNMKMYLIARVIGWQLTCRVHTLFLRTF